MNVGNINAAGIIGWGVYIPPSRIDTVALDCYRTFGADSQSHLKVANRRCASLGVSQFAIPAVSEDSTTMAIEASVRALVANRIAPERLGAIYLGSESRGEYKVRPTSAIIASYLGATREVWIKDIDTSCAGGAVALEDCLEKVALGKVEVGLAIGSDVALYPSGPAELTQGAGAAALLLGRGSGVMATLLDSFCTAVHSEDFLRRNGQEYPYLNPMCSKRLYQGLCREAVFGLLERLSYRIGDFDRIAFHTPYERLTLQLAKDGLGLTDEEIQTKVRPHLSARFIGNAYAASSLISLVLALELSRAGEKILLCSYGSGAMALALAFEVVHDGLAVISKKQTFREIISESRVQSIEVYEKWRELYSSLRRNGGSPFQYVCKVCPEGEVKQTISICRKCGRVQGIAPQPICSSDKCRGDMVQIRLPTLGQITEVTRYDRHLYRRFCDGFVPLETHNTGNHRIGERVRLTTRVIEVEGEEGPVCYGPAYVPEKCRIESDCECL
ncbi:MAG: hydroxymethylglutaryl-CoA synthase family protein [Candidatus Hodarchaeota archaeon]